MYMRFVNLRVKEGRQQDLVGFYEDRVIPALGEAKGCIYASLLRPSDDDQEFVSLTLWRSRRAAEDYEASGLYDELLDESDESEVPPQLAESTCFRERPHGPENTVHEMH